MSSDIMTVFSTVLAVLWLSAVIWGILTPAIKLLELLIARMKTFIWTMFR